ncbi:uncharacterized protein [Penaeus vannamei]|uniref:uncharacterized protein n=1 Tax=Penaeus vannamei TaxID=6689 RepID=UPI00387F8A84
MAFVDYQKAFDSVDIHKVLEYIKNQGVEPVKRLDRESRVFQNLDWETKGIKIDGDYLSHFRFTDNIVLVANNLQDLQQMLNELNNESKKPTGNTRLIKRTGNKEKKHTKMASFRKSKCSLQVKKIPVILKRKVHDQRILPTGTYGAETWNRTKKMT